MDCNYYVKIAKDHMERLCKIIGARPTGSIPNKHAADYFFKILSSSGFKTRKQNFKCMDWVRKETYIKAGKKIIQAYASPYSVGFKGSALLLPASTLQELERIDVERKILLMHGDIAREQLMPKNFPFYNPSRHVEIIKVLEEKKPAAIIAVTSKNPQLAGAVYPFPLFEDGDFGIPSAYISDKSAKPLFEHRGKLIELAIGSKRIPSHACNIVGSKIKGRKKIVFCAHLDTKPETPGALDNASGITVLLVLAKMLEEYSGPISIEIAALNGEDYYSAKGHLIYLGLIKKAKENIVAGINLDGAGYKGKNTAYSLFNFMDDEKNWANEVFVKKYGFSPIKNWHQGDHMLFVQQGLKAAAVTSENLGHIMSHIAHTQKDDLENIGFKKLADIACSLKDIIYSCHD